MRIQNEHKIDLISGEHRVRIGSTSPLMVCVRVFEMASSIKTRKQRVSTHNIQILASSPP